MTDAQRGQWGYLQSQGVKLKLVQSMDDVAEFKRWLGERRSILAYDTETTGFSPERDRIRLAQFGDLQTGWAIPWDHWAGVVIETLRDYEGNWVLHNAKFDIRQSMDKIPDLKWPWHRTDDTLTMAHLINPLRPKGLKPLSAMYIDPQAASAQRQLHDGMENNKWTWETVPMDFPPYWIYAAMDPVLTCHVYELFKPQMKPYEWVYDLEMGTTRVITKMEQRGARIDLDYVVKKNAELLDYIARANAWLRDECGIAHATGGNLLKYFNDHNVFIPHKLTPGGTQSMDKEVMQSIDHIVARTVLSIRKAEKNVGPYFSNFVKLADSESRLHPNIWTMGTRTARMSVTDPALQTLPRKDPLVRGAFIPSEGNALITCDYDQIEARLMAHFAKSQPLIDAFNRPEDFFLQMASQIYGEQITDKKDSRRDLTKGGTYGKIYGAGIATMADTAGVPFEQMQGVMGKFDKLYPEVRAMQNTIVDLGRRRLRTENMGYVMTPYGRRLASDPGKEYTLVNYLIQSHAAEILKKKLIELDTVLDDGMMILPVHDEVVFDVPAEDANDIRRTVEETMTDMTSYMVPITASSDLLLTNWGEKYKK